MNAQHHNSDRIPQPNGAVARRTALAGVVGAGALSAGVLLAPSASAQVRTPALLAPTRTLKYGMSGADVRDMQAKLYALRFWMPSVDGSFGFSTQQAVWAFQKAYGLSRTGEWGATERARIATAQRIGVRYKNTFRIEVDKTRQLLLVGWGYDLAAWIFNTSTGANHPFQVGSRWYDGRTPSGTFKVYRTVRGGWVTGPLGSMYKPFYFNGGIAIHGSPSIPAYNASHGCCRVSTAAQDWLISTQRNMLTSGRVVSVY